MKNKNKFGYLLLVGLLGVPVLGLAGVFIDDIDRRLIIAAAFVVTLLGIFGVILDECCRIKRRITELRRKRRRAKKIASLPPQDGGSL